MCNCNHEVIGKGCRDRCLIEARCQAEIDDYNGFIWFPTSGAKSHMSASYVTVYGGFTAVVTSGPASMAGLFSLKFHAGERFGDVPEL